MKVTVFTTSLSGTGVGRVMLALAEGFYEKGFDVELVLMSRNVAYKTSDLDKIPAIYLSCSRHWASFIPFLRYVRRARPNVIISALDVPNIISAWCAHLTRPSPIVFVSQHNIDRFMFSSENILKYKLLQQVLRRSFALADGVIAVSEGVANHIGLLGIINKEKIHVIHNGLDSKKIWNDSKKMCDEPLIDAKIPTILSIGRLDENKDMHCVINAFAIVRSQLKCNLLILGEGEQRPQLEALCKSIGHEEHVKMPGFVSNPFPYLARASVFVLASKKEALPTVIIEALALGIPVVCADSEGGGPREILDEGRYGRLVPIGNAAAFAAALLDTLKKPHSPRDLRDRASEYSLDRCINRIIYLIETCAKKS